MDTKICCRCNKEKSIDLFANKKPGKNGNAKQGYCKQCHSEYTRAHYLENKQKYKSATIGRRPMAVKACQAHVVEYLQSHPCVDCGESNIVVLEFDHRRPELKEAMISVLVSTGSSIKRLQTEIDKCDVRCANCHRIKTAEAGGWYRTKI